jgi:hypothetical protein
MSLLHKVRILMGALARRPFMPRPERVNLDDGPDSPRDEAQPADRVPLDAQEPEAQDTERVADLIAQQKRDEAS